MKNYLNILVCVAMALALGACSEDDWKDEWEGETAPSLDGMYRILYSENPKTDAKQEYAAAYQVYDTDDYSYTYNLSSPLQGIREQYKVDGNIMWHSGYPSNKDSKKYIKLMGTNNWASSNSEHTNVTYYQTISNSRYPWGVWEYKYYFEPSSEDQGWYYYKVNSPATPYCAFLNNTYYSFKTSGNPSETKISNVVAKNATTGSFNMSNNSFYYEYGSFTSTGETGLFIVSNTTGAAWFLMRHYAESHNLVQTH